MRLTLLLILPLLLLLVAAISVAAALWLTPGEIELTWQGWLALGLGVLGTLLLGVALMGLLFFSARHGHGEARFESGEASRPDIDRGDPSARL